MNFQTPGSCLPACEAAQDPTTTQELWVKPRLGEKPTALTRVARPAGPPTNAHTTGAGAKECALPVDNLHRYTVSPVSRQDPRGREPRPPSPSGRMSRDPAQEPRGSTPPLRCRRTLPHMISSRKKRCYQGHRLHTPHAHPVGRAASLTSPLRGKDQRWLQKPSLDATGNTEPKSEQHSEEVRCQGSAEGFSWPSQKPSAGS